jgi:hypothetical protein
MKSKTFALVFFLFGFVIVSMNPLFKFTGFSISEDTIFDFSFYFFGVLAMFIGGFLIAVQRNSDFGYTKHVSEDYIKKRGWTEEMVRQTIAGADASSLRLSRDNNSPYGLAIVYSLGDDQDNYVVRSVDGRLLQVSDRNRNWNTPNFRDSYLYQGVKKDREIKTSGKAGHKK